MGGVQRRDALGRLEDHRVPLDEPTLVAQPAARVAFTCQRLRVAGGLLELGVHTVDEQLLGSDLLLGDLSGQQSPSYEPEDRPV